MTAEAVPASRSVLTFSVVARIARGRPAVIMGAAVSAAYAVQRSYVRKVSA